MMSVDQPVEWELVREIEGLGENYPQCHFVHQVTDVLTWARTRAAVVGSRRLTAWAMARPQDHCNYSIHTFFSVFSSRCLVAASNGGRSPSSGLPNCPWSQLPASHFSHQIKVKVMSRRTVSRPVCLRVKHPSWDQDQIFITVRQLRVCWCGVPLLRRERVCRL
jgi:hypothetical protein